MILSVITINYQNFHGLVNTVGSVLSQTYTDFEWLVIDGGSTDGSKELIEQYSDRIAWWCSEKDSGIYNAMNKGVAHATGDYCLFLNSGDVLHSSSAIGDLTGGIENSDIDFIIGKTLFTKYGSVGVVPEHLTMNWFYENSLPHPSTFIRTELLRNNPYDESLKIVSDWKFFLQEIIIHGASYRFEDVLVTDFDCDGISSNLDACNIERSRVLSEFLPSRVIEDYEMFRKSDYYYNTDYDRFFMELRKYRGVSKWLYNLDVVVLRIMSVFRNRYKFASTFSLLK